MFKKVALSTLIVIIALMAAGYDVTRFKHWLLGWTSETVWSPPSKDSDWGKGG